MSPRFDICFQTGTRKSITGRFRQITFSHQPQFDCDALCVYYYFDTHYHRVTAPDMDADACALEAGLTSNMHNSVLNYALVAPFSLQPHSLAANRNTRSMPRDITVRAEMDFWLGDLNIGHQMLMYIDPHSPSSFTRFTDIHSRQLHCLLLNITLLIIACRTTLSICRMIHEELYYIAIIFLGIRCHVVTSHPLI